MATHSSVLAWRIPRMGEPGGLLSMGSHRVGHDWSDLVAVAAAAAAAAAAAHHIWGFPVAQGWRIRLQCRRYRSKNSATEKRSKVHSINAFCQTGLLSPAQQWHPDYSSPPAYLLPPRKIWLLVRITPASSLSPLFLTTEEKQLTGLVGKTSVHIWELESIYPKAIHAGDWFSLFHTCPGQEVILDIYFFSD